MTHRGSLEDALRLDPHRWKEFRTFGRGWSAPKRFERLSSTDRTALQAGTPAAGDRQGSQACASHSPLSCSWSTLASSALARPRRSSGLSWILDLQSCGYHLSIAPAQPAVSFLLRPTPACPAFRHISCPSTAKGHLLPVSCSSPQNLQPSSLFHFPGLGPTCECCLWLRRDVGISCL